MNGSTSGAPWLTGALRSPPAAPEPLSSESSRASFAKSSPLSSGWRSPSALALAWASFKVRRDAGPGGRDQDVADLQLVKIVFVFPIKLFVRAALPRHILHDQLGQHLVHGEATLLRIVQLPFTRLRGQQFDFQQFIAKPFPCLRPGADLH